MPGGASCASVDFLGSDLDCGEVAGFSSSIGESQERDSSLTKGLRGGYTCSVPGCYKNTKKNKEVSFHRFPKNKQLRDKWINAIKRKKFVPSDHHRVCSSHFEGGKRRNASAIPTIFPLILQPKSRKEPAIRVNVPPKKIIKPTKPMPAKPLEDGLVEELIIVTKIVGSLQDENATLIEALQNQKMEIENLKMRLESHTFCLRRFAGSDEDIRFYTGFPNYKTFMTFYDFLLPAASQLNYWGSNYSENRADEKHGPQRKMQPIDELFMVLYRMRCDALEKDIADRFGVSVSNVSRTLNTWINFLYHTLKQLPIWPSSKVIKDTMPKCFKDQYPDTRVILDCTEIFIEMPSSFRAQSQTYSTYKSHNTAKGLIGIAPNGFVTFISDLYGGHISDQKITEMCGIIDLLEPNDMVMADRGFDIQHILAEKKVKLNIPPFMKGKEQLSLEEELETRNIASVRIHVERAIERIKNYRILQGTIPNRIHSQLDQIWFICCSLTNFLSPLVQ